jgi:hypothetical protein
MISGTDTNVGAPTLVIPYREFRALPPLEADSLPVGTLVQNVRARDLLTAQPWFDDEKIRHACGDFRGGRCITAAFAYTQIIDERCRLILTDGQHRAGLVLANGLREIDVMLEPQPESLYSFKTEKIQPLERIVRANLHLLRWND